MVERAAASERRQGVKAALLTAAERTIESQGLRALRARTLAEEVGCAVGAIYNVVEDLDELILAVNSRTLALLERELTAAGTAGDKLAGRPRAIDRLVCLALAYLDFAVARKRRWRALFEHRMAEGRNIPDWYLEEQQRLFGYVEEPLRELQPDATPERRALVARSLFSAVHGLVVLGLEEKLQPVPLPALREQVAFVVSAIGRGMTARS
jgi:AcrR family transcriptional regulator